MPARVCLECGQLSGAPSRRGLCPECERERQARRPSRQVYDTRRWQHLSRQAVARWVRAHGWLCPGWGQPAHPSYDLTADHPVALAAGGPAYPDELQVLCRSCNGRKAAQPATTGAA